MLELENKTALVTGASRGIGRATASAIAKAGAHVLVHYGRSRQEAESLVVEIRRKGGNADAVSADLGTPDGASLPAKQVRTIVGDRLDVLVLNAGILGPRGIRVNAVAPGVIDTDMSNFTKTETGREVALGMQALKRLGKPEDVADVVAFMASDGARWITGASIPVDGGSKL